MKDYPAEKEKEKEKIIFRSDRVQVETGKRVDNSGKVTFIVGEYELNAITPLTTIIDKNLKVTVEIEND